MADGIDVRIDVDGVERLQRWLVSSPLQLERGLLSATTKSTLLVQSAIRANTRVRTGALVGSELTRVEARPGDIRGVIFSALRYARYREHGGRGGADHMFRQGLAQSREAVYQIYEMEARDLVESL